MHSYPVRLVPTGEGHVRLVFPDLPHLKIEGEDEEEALFRAGFVLDIWLGHLALSGRNPPPPSQIYGAPMVTIRKSRNYRIPTRPERKYQPNS